MKKMKVDAIISGTVIDHIPAGKGLKLADILNLQDDNILMIGMNLQSKKIGKKDIIKIENRELTKIELNSLALIAPSATVTVIKDYQVDKKLNVELQGKIEDLIVCPNPKCITNIEKMKSHFRVYRNEAEIHVICAYCEKKYNMDEVKIKIK
jgi:aspartate carbamoyltransferase regulatory subunit